jgi:membrane-associated protease RseP (regulator of RpoE activity)
METHEMPFTVSAIDDGGYVLVRHEGKLTRQEFEESTVSTRNILAEHQWNKLLIDLRGVANRVSIADVYFIIEFDLRVFPSVIIGVVFPPERKEDGRFADTVAENRGVKLKSFVEYEQAVAWLNEKQT